MKKIVWVVGFIFILCLAALLYLFFTYPETSPFVSAQYIVTSWFNPHKHLQKQILGFLPYWQVRSSNYIRFDSISEINYFSLSVGSDGNFVTVVSNQTNPGWLWWQNDAVKNLLTKAKIYGDKVTFTVSAQNNDVITNVLQNKSAQQRLIQSIVTQLTERRMDGVIIDFEYDGKPDISLQQEFTSFALSLRQQLKQANPKATLSLTLLPLSAREIGLFDLPRLSSIFDRFIGMSYDYYAASSDIAGPIAPLRGFQEGKYFFDVTTTYADYEKFLPKGKIIMGVPYYGWDWPVTQGNKIQSTTLSQNDTNGYAAVMSYGRMRGDTNIKQSQCDYDTLAQEPWCWYTDPTTHKDHQVWFENEKSLGAKYDFMQSQQLSGVAIWTLGYDKQYPELWNLLTSHFSQQQ